MKRSLNIFVLTFAVMFPKVVLCQDSPTGEIQDAQILIEKDKELSLPKSNRLFKPALITPANTQEIPVNYSFSNPSFDFEPYVSDVKAQELQISNLSIEDVNYVKLGFGNFISPLVEGYYGYRQRSNAFSAFLNHESFARGPVREEESATSNTLLRLNSRHDLSKFMVNPQFNYGRESYYFYGYDDLEETLNPNPVLVTDQIVVNNFSVGGRISTMGNADFSTYFNPQFGVTSMGTTDLMFNKEVFFSLDIGGDYKISESLNGSITSDYEWLSYESATTQKRFVFSARPELQWKSESLVIQGGINLTLAEDSSTSTKFHVYPLLDVKWFVSDDLTVFTKVSGGMTANRLSDLITTNRYLNDSLALLNTNQQFKIKAGVSYQVADQLSISPFISYARSVNESFFIGSANDSSRFETVYEFGNFDQVNLGASVVYSRGKSTVAADLVYNSYTTQNLEEAWYLPTTQLSVRYDQGFGEKFDLYSSLNLLDGIKGVQSLGGLTEDLKAILDLNLGAKYQVNSSFTAFTEFKNVVGGEYARYLNYPVRGLSGKLGFIYRL